MYEVILTETATVSRRHKFKKPMCPRKTGPPYPSVDIDVSTDVDNSYLKAAKVLIISRCFSSTPQAHGVHIKKKAVILQNSSKATNYNRSTTEVLSEKTVDRLMIFFKFTRRNSNKVYARTCNINKHNNMYFSFIQVNGQRKNTRANPCYQQIPKFLFVTKNLNVT